MEIRIWRRPFIAFMTAIKSCKERKRGKTQPYPTLSSVARRERRAEGKPGSQSRVPSSPLCLLDTWEPLLGHFGSATRWRAARCWINELIDSVSIRAGTKEGVGTSRRRYGCVVQTPVHGLKQPAASLPCLWWFWYVSATWRAWAGSRWAESKWFDTSPSPALCCITSLLPLLHSPTGPRTVLGLTRGEVGAWVTQKG